ncbi:MAG: type III pantothenate kinase [Candidatus Latescibacteria bacterium]|nr:type III pantothenate kinase [Candidatus Latescibacterota bacterium]
MILAIDISNTHTKLGVYDGEQLRGHWRLPSRRDYTVDECGILTKLLCQEAGITVDRITRTVIGSVVPSLTSIYQEMVDRYFQTVPLIVTADLEIGLTIHYDNPRGVGADRIANAVGAFERYGGPAIVVDLGTATTFDVISPEGDYVGGVIAPGIETSAAELFQRAARLWGVEIAVPDRVIGQDTEQCLRAGIVYGAVGQVDGIVERIWEELGARAVVIATGGLAGLITPLSRTIQQLDPLLTLDGLRRIALRVDGRS